MGHETILCEIPVGLATLRNLLVRDRDQYRRQKRKSAGNALPPDTKRASQRTAQLRPDVAPGVGVAYGKLEINAEQPFTRSELECRNQQCLDRHPTQGDQDRREQGMPDPERATVADHPRAVQRREQKREHQSPDRIIEQPRRQAVPRPGLAGAAGLRALELGHAQLEDPARVLLGSVRSQKDALFSSPVEDRQVGLRD